MAEPITDRGYERPVGLERALELRARGATILAGGTDYYPARAGRPLRDRASRGILDISRIAELRSVKELDDSYRIGALVTWTEIAEGALPDWFQCLKLAAREVGGRQIQNRGTIGGNLCNASPAADGVPALMALGAEIEVSSQKGERRLGIAEFILGPRKIALEADEILTAVIVPKPRTQAVSSFFKLGSRRYLVISLVMASAMVEHDRRKITSARIAVGACSPVARRLEALEQALVGQTLDDALATYIRTEHLEVLSPIDDPRASAEYRSDAAMTALVRLLSSLGAG